MPTNPRKPFNGFVNLFPGPLSPVLHPERRLRTRPPSNGQHLYELAEAAGIQRQGRPENKAALRHRIGSGIRTQLKWSVACKMTFEFYILQICPYFESGLLLPTLHPSRIKF